MGKSQSKLTQEQLGDLQKNTYCKLLPLPFSSLCLACLEHGGAILSYNHTDNTLLYSRQEGVTAMVRSSLSMPLPA